MELKGREYLASLRPRYAETGMPGVRVWQLNGAERTKFEIEFEDKPTERVLGLVRLCLGDESGRFDPPFDAGALPAHVLAQCYELAAKVNVLTVETAEDVRGN